MTTERNGAWGSDGMRDSPRIDDAADGGDDALLIFRGEARIERQRKYLLAGRLAHGQIAAFPAVFFGVELVQVHRREVQADADAGLAERTHEFVATDAD